MKLTRLLISFKNEYSFFFGSYIKPITRARILIRLLILIGILLMLANSCKKDNNYSQEGTITDIDGNIYHSVRIGSQLWMVENLKVTKYRNGDPIDYVADNIQWENQKTGAYSWYNNDIANKALYGALYNTFVWEDDSHNIAPIGWKVPKDEDWTVLTSYLEGENVAGGKMKQTGFLYWKEPNSGATNESGFTALPGGYRRYNGVYKGISLYACFVAKTGMYRLLSYNDSIINLDAYTETLGLSIRCVKE